MTLEEYFGDWLRVIDRAELDKVLTILNRMYKVKPICPAQENVFKAFNLCKYHDCKVVFMGQDPYPQKGVATGILFGNDTSTNENDWSPSLKVVRDSVIDLRRPHNLITFDPTLESWAKQGILMINSALTVEMNKVGSHTMLWRPFISKLLKKMSEYDTGMIYVLFGGTARTFKPYIGKYNDVIEIEHPAYFARINQDMPSDIFYEINRLLKSRCNCQINWYKEEKYEQVETERDW